MENGLVTMIENDSKKSSKSYNPLNPGSDIPPNWSYVKLGDVGQIVTGTTPPKNNLKNYGDFVPLYKPSDLNIGTNILHAKDNLSKIGIENARLLPKGSILVTCIGATIGKTGLIKRAGASNQQINAIVPGPNFISEFIYYFCISENFQKQILKNASSTTLPILNKSKFEKLTIPLPPLQEQKKIVEKIEEIFSGLESGVASLKKAKEQIRLYRQSVLASAFSGKLLMSSAQRQAHNKILKAAEPKVEYSNQLPDGWKWVNLKELTSVLGDGLHGTPKYSEDGDYYFINGNNLSNGKIEIKANTKRVTEEEYKKYKKLLNDRTIFVSINGTLGKTAFYNDEKIILGKSACYFNLKQDIDKKYIRYFLTSEDFIRYANNTATGSTIKNVSLQAMRELEVPMPPSIQLQSQIVSEIEKRFSEADNLEKAIDDSLVKSETLRQSILKQAFEGKLV